MKFTLTIDEAIEKLQKLKEQLGGNNVLILSLPSHGLWTNVIDLVVETADNDPTNQWVGVIVRR